MADERIRAIVGFVFLDLLGIQLQGRVLLDWVFDGLCWRGKSRKELARDMRVIWV